MTPESKKALALAEFISDHPSSALDPPINYDLPVELSV